MGHPVFGTTCSWYKGYHWELYSGEKRASRAPRVTKSTHTRKFGNHVTVHHLQPARPHHRHTNVYSHTFYLLWEPREPRRKLMAHQCCDQLTAVKTRHPLTSITWPYRGLRCRPIQVEYFFEVIRWQVTKFMLLFLKVSLLFLKVSPCLLLLLSHIWALARSCWVVSFFLHFSSSDWTSSPVSSFRRCIQQRDFRANSTCFLFHLPFVFWRVYLSRTARTVTLREGSSFSSRCWTTVSYIFVSCMVFCLALKGVDCEHFPSQQNIMCRSPLLWFYSGKLRNQNQRKIILKARKHNK